jgi:hypothetical protein
MSSSAAQQGASAIVSKETKESTAATTSLSTGRKRKVAYFYDGICICHRTIRRLLMSHELNMCAV